MCIELHYEPTSITPTVFLMLSGHEMMVTNDVTVSDKGHMSDRTGALQGLNRFQSPSPRYPHAFSNGRTNTGLN